MDISLIVQQRSVSAPALQSLQMELVWVILIAAGLLLVGGFLGTTIGFIITARDMKHARHEAIKLREMRDLAETAHSLALTERERALKELQEKQQQLDEARSRLQQQSDELQQKLLTSQQAQSDQNMTISQMQAKLYDALTQLNEYRARVTEADHATAEMQEAMKSVEALLELQRARLTSPALSGDEMEPAGVPISRDQRLAQMQAQLDAILQHLTPATTANKPVVKTLPAIPEPDTIGVAASDDSLRLEDVKGIGAGYAQRLREGGINTMHDLAGTTPEQLAGIIKAPAFRRPNYAAWIDTARKMTKS